LEGTIRYLKTKGRWLLVLLDDQILVIDNGHYTKITNKYLFNVNAVDIH